MTALYDHTVPQLDKMLGNLDVWLAQGIEAAEAAGTDPEALLEARLADDMFTLTRQVQSACDNAKFIVARLSQTDPPSDPDDESTLAELRARIAKTRTFVQSVDRDAFDGAEERLLTLQMLQGARCTGMAYLVEFGLPNFYFHANMAYAILRRTGAPLGKRAYIGSIELLPPA